MMKEYVWLIIMGYLFDGLVGEVMIIVDEKDFFFVRFIWGEIGVLYEFCILDYSLVGWRVRYTVFGWDGVLVVAVMVGAS